MSAGSEGATAAGVEFTHLLTQLALIPATVATGGAAASYAVEKMAGLLGKVAGAERALGAGVADTIAAKGANTVAAGERAVVYDNPSQLVQSRVDDLLSQIPENSQGRITMGVAVVEDANGVRSVLVSTSEPRGYLRPGVSLQPGETVIPGTGHAEADIVNYANANGLKVIDIGATRPVCPGCQNTIAPTGANITTLLKPLPKR